MSTLFRAKKFLEYQWKAKTKYYIHSPFVYQFYLNVLEGQKDDILLNIETLRKKLRHNHSRLDVKDFGTGTASHKEISILEKDVAVPAKYGELLYRLVKYFNCQNILELGTCIGISTCYMALANSKAQIVSLEGSESLLKQADVNLSSLGVKNVRLLKGNFDDTLTMALLQIKTPDLIFFDGNHRKEATLRYFNQCLSYASDNSIFIFDDIYWGKEMSEAWNEIKQHPRITLTLDVFQFGICFFKRDKLAKENFVLRY